MSAGHRSDRGRRRPEELLARRGGSVELLRVPAALFGAVSGARSRLYDLRLLPISRLDVPVVCVGNLTAGGTGKTPLVIWLARWFAARGWRPGVLSRGYGSQALDRSLGAASTPGAPRGDEARLLARTLPGVPMVQNADRVAGGRELERAGVDVILMDDGFQHRRLHRERDIVLVDATRPWGLPPAGGEAVRALLPRGLLRESPSALARADAIVVTRCDQVEQERLRALVAELAEFAPGVPLVTSSHRVTGLRDGAGGFWPLSRLAGRQVDLVSAIGNPDAFEQTIERLGARVREHRRFVDHHAYTAADLIGLGAADKLDPEAPPVPVVTTSKDAVKLETLLPGALAVEIEFEPQSGEAAFEAVLEAIRPGRARLQRQSLHEGLHG
ncbi:tetraacyldisaccharide 4'-kinase [Engelhardtia mirabilis]|uniref:Tetraacyldisaccharide 4'-kinase n=1 Tax=Engelhardtia mirabilis TaxID=2528011 RepID=A0A518BPP9_9BACT|nr:Tetraacyldisaccharide 4'-kinase [Planctomycetes bacterium Pla133]QDV03276.1 Tetraacyldisaccharide 4'-kinase [Planctomycetes bacterium Pla86]